MLFRSGWDGEERHPDKMPVYSLRLLGVEANSADPAIRLRPTAPGPTGDLRPTVPEWRGKAQRSAPTKSLRRWAPAAWARCIAVKTDGSGAVGLGLRSLMITPNGEHYAYGYLRNTSELLLAKGLA